MDIRIVDGRLTKDAEVRLNKTNGTKFLSFTIANNGFAKGVQTTTYFNIISYNEFDISRAESLTKGKLVVVSGRPNESITKKDDNTYLNRSIMAHNIESGTPNQVKEATTVTTTVQNDSLGATTPQVKVTTPYVATCEIPPVAVPVVSQPSVTVPSVNTHVTTNQPESSGAFQASVGNPTMPNVNVDDLPF